MPTKGEMPRSSVVSVLADSHNRWTDDLFPICDLTGIGHSVNQIYRPDGLRIQSHDCEDTSFHFKVENKDIYFYGVFDGHDGPKASNFAAQWMPAEVLFEQLKNKQTDEEIIDVLLNSFDAVEKNFFKSIDDLLADRANLQFQLQGLNEYVAFEQYPDLVVKLQNVSSEISGGSTAVVALVCCNKLFIGNVGDCRAILCRRNEIDKKKIEVQQLSVDHDIKNEDELLRLSQLGLDIEKIRQVSRLGTQKITRCLGNYHVKGGYKDFDILSSAIQEPVVAEPFIRGGLPLEDSWLFLVLASSGLIKTLEEATKTHHANEDIAHFVLEEFAVQSTLMGVAQAVVDKVVRLHHDAYMKNNKELQKREDITLLVRTFNQTFGGSDYRSQGSTYESSIFQGPPLFEPICHSLSLDESGRIQPYVDFSTYYQLVEVDREHGNLHPGLNF